MDHTSPPAARGSFVAGLLRGFLPVAVASIMVALTLAGAGWIRNRTLDQGFFAQQAADLFVLGLGLIVTTLVFAVLAVRTFRLVREWQVRGAAASAGGALWALGLTVGLVLLPVVLAVVFPQHPVLTR